METFKVDFNPDLQKGVFSISLVDQPAIEVDWISLSKDEIEIQLKETKRGLLVSPVLIPEKVILRKDENGNPYNIVFPKETIELAQRYFHINGFQSQSSIEHNNDLKLKGVTIVESWIKEFEQDKSNEYGFDLPIGTWFAVMKVDNEEVKAKIKSGEINGFSIDGAFKLNNYKMSKENEFMTVLKNFFNPEKEVKLSEEQPAEEVVVETKLASLEVGSTVPDGTFTAEDGTVFTVVEGKITEVVIAEVKDEEVVVEEMTAPDLKAELTLHITKVFEDLKVELSKKEEVVEEVVSLTKQKPVATFKEPKNFKERIFNQMQNN